MSCYRLREQEGLFLFFFILNSNTIICRMKRVELNPKIVGVGNRALLSIWMCLSHMAQVTAPQHTRDFPGDMTVLLLVMWETLAYMNGAESLRVGKWCFDFQSGEKGRFHKLCQWTWHLFQAKFWLDLSNPFKKRSSDHKVSNHYRLILLLVSGYMYFNKTSRKQISWALWTKEYCLKRYMYRGVSSNGLRAWSLVWICSTLKKHFF